MFTAGWLLEVKERAQGAKEKGDGSGQEQGDG